MRIMLLWIAVVGAALVSASEAAELSMAQQFSQFQATYGRRYFSVQEEAMRFQVFSDNVVNAAAMTERARAAGRDTVFGVTKFSDLTSEEFDAQMKGYSPAAAQAVKVEPYALGDVHVSSAPSFFDWRKSGKGVVTPVKDQGNCGSCWAFSATEQIESNWVLAGGNQTILSPQQIVSCDLLSLGCHGGDTVLAYNYVENTGGLMTEASYPYEDGSDADDDPPRLPCMFDKSEVAVKISGFKYATTTLNETIMSANLAALNPLSVCLATGGWQSYVSGVLGPADCGILIDHCVQAVGYNLTASPPYWIVRNSWNTDWGIKGYIYLEYGKDTCIIAGQPTYVTIAN